MFSSRWSKCCCCSVRTGAMVIALLGLMSAGTGVVIYSMGLVTMPQTISAGIHHQWDEKLNLLGSVGWDEISEFGHVQVEIDDNGIPGTTVNADFRDTWNLISQWAARGETCV